jgi:hypothetical protein
MAQELWPRDKLMGKILNWFVSRPKLTLALAVLAALAPFITKPFNIDDRYGRSPKIRRWPAIIWRFQR